MTNPQWGFAVRGESTDTIEIDVYDFIGRGAEWYGGASAKSVLDKLRSAKGAKEIRLRVNSGGGDVFEGFAIYNLLNDHKARVVAQVDSLAASMASVILMAADEIQVASNAFVMIHNPWGYGMGEADDMRKQADLLDQLRDQIADAYVARTGQSKASVLAMMDDETWLTAADAKAKGFADVVKPAKGEARASAFASVNLADLKNVPADLRTRVESARESARQTFKGDQTPVQTPIVNPPSRVEAQAQAQEKRKTMELAALLVALGALDVNAAIARHQQLTRIENATGKTGDDAQGLILAFKASHEKLPVVQAELVEVKAENAKLKGEGELAQLEGAIVKANAEKKLTPALEQDIRAQFAAKDISLKGALSMLGNLAPIPALAIKTPAGPMNGAAKQGEQTVVHAQDGEGVNASGVPTFNGKTFTEMNGPERVALHKADASLFARMQATFKPVRKSADGK